MAIAIIKSKKPGYANLTIRGWNGSNENLKIAIFRTDENRYFYKYQADLNAVAWKNHEYWLDIGKFAEDEQVIEATLPPEITDGIAYLASKNISFLIFIKNDKVMDEAIVHFLGEVIASNFLEKNIVELDATSIKISNHNHLVNQDKRKFWLIVVVMLLFVPAIAAAFLYFFRQHTETFNPCESSKGRDEISFIQACLASNPPDSQLFKILEQAKEDGSCEIVQRIYANKAHSGSIAMALKYAREYDPNYYQENLCFKPNLENAIYWYEHILEKNPLHREASENLKKLDSLEKL